MKKEEIKVGGFYRAMVSDKLVTVRIDSTHSKGGWNATNTKTGKRIHIKSAQRLRGKAESREKKSEANEPAEATVTKKDKAKAPTKAATKKVAPKKAGGKQKPKRVSALDAAAQVLAKSAQPMGAKALIAAMAEQGLWSSPAGKTPHATLYAAIHREIASQGNEARFEKVDRGLFAINKATAK